MSGLREAPLCGDHVPNTKKATTVGSSVKNNCTINVYYFKCEVFVMALETVRVK